MSGPIIHVEQLGKCYRIRHERPERYRTLRDTMASGFSRLLHPKPSGARQKAEGRPKGEGGSLSQSKISNPQSSDEDFWALKDVTFEVQQGEVVGIIGRNGAGKSTLLKILSRITEPTEGRVTLRGRVSSLLEVGTGFHPELTGRENIFLNGAILGMSKAEIRRKFDEIVAFAEVERFLDTPVKHYSSGMYVRLAFSVAAHLEPEILVVDEVLAVGDAAFQQKCLGKMNAVSTQGRTVLFVSHNMAVISQLCRQTVLLDAGKVILKGGTEEVVRQYHGKGGASPVCAKIDAKQHQANWGGSSKMRLISVRLLNAAYQTFTVHWKECIEIELAFQVYEKSSNLYFAVGVSNLQGMDLIGAHHDDDGAPLYSFEPGVYALKVKMQNPLRAGLYFLTVGASTAVGAGPIFRVADAACLEVLDVALSGQFYPQYGGNPINGDAQWSQPVAAAGPVEVP